MSLPFVLAARQAVAQAVVDPATVPVSQFYGALFQVMKAGHSAPFPQRYQILAPAVDAAFDLAGILRISVGAFWSSLPAAQQQSLFQVFRGYTIANYVASFHSAKDRTILVEPTTRPVGSQRVVTTTITKLNRDPLRIDYVMRNEDAGWKVVDVLLDGTISRVAVQRSDFASLVSAGNATPLIDSLRSKLSTLSDGAMSG
jgi:phospholipid transport system substrate-binding protein